MKMAAEREILAHPVVRREIGNGVLAVVWCVRLNFSVRPVVDSRLVSGPLHRSDDPREHWTVFFFRSKEKTLHVYPHDPAFYSRM